MSAPTATSRQRIGAAGSTSHMCANIQEMSATDIARSAACTRPVMRYPRGILSEHQAGNGAANASRLKTLPCGRGYDMLRHQHSDRGLFRIST